MGTSYCLPVRLSVMVTVSLAMNSLLACLDAQPVSFPVYVIVQELRKLGLLCLSRSRSHATGNLGLKEFPLSKGGRSHRDSCRAAALGVVVQLAKASPRFAHQQSPHLSPGLPPPPDTPHAYGVAPFSKGELATASSQIRRQASNDCFRLGDHLL